MKKFRSGILPLSGGELPAMALIDAVVRQLPGCWAMPLRRWKIRS